LLDIWCVLSFLGPDFCFKGLLLQGPIFSASVSPDGRWLASGSNDQTVRIWNVSTGAQQCIVQGHKEEVLSVNFSPAGHYLASASEDAMVRIWNYRAR
jgi:WD40 repeat protein